MCNVLSKFQPILCGVTQGSILGPLLFIMYINDIESESDILKSVTFADDTNLFISNKNLHDLTTTVNDELVHVANWLKMNKLSINIKKTHFILFHHKQKVFVCNSDVEMNVQSIQGTVATKFMRVIRNENLIWVYHINALIN